MHFLLLVILNFVWELSVIVFSIISDNKFVMWTDYIANTIWPWRYVKNKARLLIKLDAHRDNKVMRVSPAWGSRYLYTLTHCYKLQVMYNILPCRILSRLFSSNQSYDKPGQTERYWQKQGRGSIKEFVTYHLRYVMYILSCIYNVTLLRNFNRNLY